MKSTIGLTLLCWWRRRRGEGAEIRVEETERQWWSGAGILNLCYKSKKPLGMPKKRNNPTYMNKPMQFEGGRPVGEFMAIF